MGAVRSGQPASALVAARRPVEPCRLPRAAPRTWLGTSGSVRRLVPTATAVRRAESHGVALWERSPPERARARAAMQAVVGGTARAGEVEALAREHVIESRVREALFWQPWSAPALDSSSAARLRDVLAGERGVLLSSCHVGPYLLGVSVIAAHGRTTYSLAGDWLFDPPAPGYWGRRIARRRNEARARDERLVRIGGSFDLLRSLLAQREVVSVFFALPGRRETPFLGKPVMLASGSARLAVQADALVVPIRTRRSADRVWVDVSAPLDPRAFAGPDQLHEALAATHEHSILELPATMEDPNREGAWEQSADGEGWRLPHAA